ncbi:MAG TPA: HD domain-containing phosphohydrolase [Clostridia bacterium]|nr:HD domain-containing phosphohydrolase [Clostridia bacterium]
MAQDDGELIRLALEQLPDGVVVADAHDRVVALNAQARLLRGVRPDTSIAFPLLFGGSVTDDIEQGLGALRTGTATEFSVVEGDPSTGKVYEHRCVPVKTLAGEYAGTAVTSHDVTDRQLRDARQEAKVSGLQRQVAVLQDALQERFVDGMITLVDALEARDRYTRGHSTRVALMSGKVARRVLSHAADAAEIELAARLHDIGKVAVPDRLLDKPTSLTPDEIVLMDTHPLVGEDILRPISQLRNVALIIRNHHERWDGAGYPDGLEGDHIPIGSRILALADSFDAMTSQRPYRSSLSVPEARDEIVRQIGTQFDPAIASVFLDMIGTGEIVAETQTYGEAG